VHCSSVSAAFPASQIEALHKKSKIHGCVQESSNAESVG
jgi:hypothetical protein